MSASNFINEFNRVMRGLDPLDIDSLRHREPSCIKALEACSKNSSTQAQEALAPYVKRQITEDAEWIYDDFLLFSLLCCFVKFGEFRELLRQLVSIRRRTEQGQRFSFLQDAERLVDKGQFTANSMYTVVMAEFLERAVEDPSVLRSAHDEANQVPHETQVTPFEAAIAARCQEVVAGLSINSSMSSSIIARNLWKRTRFLVMVIYLGFITTLTCAMIGVVWVSLFGGEALSSIAATIISIGAIGLVIFLWRIKGKCYLWGTNFLILLMAGTAGCQAMRSFNQE